MKKYNTAALTQYKTLGTDISFMHNFAAILDNIDDNKWAECMSPLWQHSIIDRHILSKWDTTANETPCNEIPSGGSDSKLKSKLII